MAEISLYKVTNAWTNDGESYAGAEWYLKYETEFISNGKTRVSWGLYKRGRTSTPTWLETTIELYFSSDQTITAESDSILSWTPNRFTASPNSSGTNHPHISYNPANNTTATKTGSFIISHDTSGNGNFKVQLKAAIYDGVLRDGSIKTITLSNNKPYTACYWDSNAYVRIEESIQKPGADITIKWSGAQSGTENRIVGFEVYYSLNGGNWNPISTSIASESSSITMQVPNSRGSTITAQVIIKNEQAGFNTDPKISGSCRINNRPYKPTNFNPSRTIIPSTANTVSFSMNAGSDDDGQRCSIKYSTNEDSTLRDYTIGTNLSFSNKSNELTYYFWTWDGLETSEESVSCKITKNTKPTVSIDVTGAYIYDITATKGDNGQSNNSYSYGYTYGEDRLIITTTSTKYTIGDIRYYLSNQLNGLEQGKTYNFRYWVQRNDGIESSDRVYSNQMNFTVPNLNLNPGNGPEGYFGTNINISIDKSQSNYYPTGTVSFDRIERGKQLKSIEFKNNENSSQSFNIKLTSPLTRVYGFDFTNLQIPLTFKPYSTPILSINMAGRGSEYGFGENSEHNLTIDNQDKEAIFSEDSSNNTWTFKFTPEHLWGDNGIISNIVTDDIVGKTIKLTICNDFGEEFSKDILLKFDFRETPKIEGFQVCGGVSAIKEGTEISIQGKIQYFSKSANFIIYEPQSNQIFYDVETGPGVYNKTPWVKTEMGGWESSPYVCELKNHTDPNKQIPAQEKTYTTKFNITAQSGSISGQAESQITTIQRHTPARIRFTRLEYSNGNLIGSFKIEDFGYDSNTNGRVDSVYLDSTKIYSGNITTNNEISFEITSYDFGEANFRSLAPVCITTFDLEGAKTTKETVNLEYLVVYNILPTIAYRQNYLGVNTKNPSQNGGIELENPAITISAYNQQNTVYLVSSLNIASIDLETGKQAGFIIDCGSW